MKFTKIVKAASIPHYRNVLVVTYQNLGELIDQIEEIVDLDEEVFFRGEKEKKLIENLNSLENSCNKFMKLIKEEKDFLSKITE